MRVSTQCSNKSDVNRVKVQLSLNVFIYDVNKVGQISYCGVQTKDSSVARQHCTQIYSKVLTLSHNNILFSSVSFSKTYLLRGRM